MTDGTVEFKIDKTVKCQQPHEMYDLTIDYLDIVSVSRLQIPNEEALFSNDFFDTKNYKYNFMM